MDQHGRGPAGSALRHQHDLVEHLERTDHGHDKDKEGSGGEQWKRYIAKLLPGPCPVQFRGFVITGGDALQTGQENDHIISGILPDTYYGKGKERRMRVQQPFGPLDSEQGKKIVDQSEFRIVKPLPDDGDNNHGCNGGQKESRPVKSPEGDFLVEHDRQHKGNGHSDRHGDQCIDQRIARNLPDDRVMEHGNIVCKADEFGGRQHIVLEKADHKGCHDRHKHEHEKADNVRSQHQPCPSGIILELSRFFTSSQNEEPPLLPAGRPAGASFCYKCTLHGQACGVHPSFRQILLVPGFRDLSVCFINS